MAKYKKKRARELQHDRFRDTTMTYLDRLGDLLEGRGRTILYALGGAVVALLLIVFFVKWTNRKNDEARQELGRGITITQAPVLSVPVGDSSEPSFSSEQERAQRAVEEFEKVAPNGRLAPLFAAANPDRIKITDNNDQVATQIRREAAEAWREARYAEGSRSSERAQELRESLRPRAKVAAPDVRGGLSEESGHEVRDKNQHEGRERPGGREHRNAVPRGGKERPQRVPANSLGRRYAARAELRDGSSGHDGCIL